MADRQGERARGGGRRRNLVGLPIIRALSITVRVHYLDDFPNDNILQQFYRRSTLNSKNWPSHNIDNASSTGINDFCVVCKKSVFSITIRWRYPPTLHYQRMCTTRTRIAVPHIVALCNGLDENGHEIRVEILGQISTRLAARRVRRNKRVSFTSTHLAYLAELPWTVYMPVRYERENPHSVCFFFFSPFTMAGTQSCCTLVLRLLWFDMKSEGDWHWRYVTRAREGDQQSQSNHRVMTCIRRDRKRNSLSSCLFHFLQNCITNLSRVLHSCEA